MTSERKGRGRGVRDRLCGQRERRLVKEIDGVGLARKPRDSMNLPRPPEQRRTCLDSYTWWPARVSSGDHRDQSQIRPDANGVLCPSPCYIWSSVQNRAVSSTKFHILPLNPISAGTFPNAQSEISTPAIAVLGGTLKAGSLFP